MSTLATLTEEEIRQRFKTPTAVTQDAPRSSTQKTMKKAAVLVPFVKQDNEWHLLFIQRSEAENDRHSGQVAFAGGRYEEEDDSLQMTALREAHEEIGLLPQDVAVIGELGHHYSISNYQITPVVGVAKWPYNLQLQETEVAAAFTIPLRWLADPDNHSLQQRHYNGADIPVVYFKQYQGYLLWGATARMTLSLINLLNQP